MDVCYGGGPKNWSGGVCSAFRRVITIFSIGKSETGERERASVKQTQHDSYTKQSFLSWSDPSRDYAVGKSMCRAPPLSIQLLAAHLDGLPPSAALGLAGRTKAC